MYYNGFIRTQNMRVGQAEIPGIVIGWFVKIPGQIYTAPRQSESLGYRGDICTAAGQTTGWLNILSVCLDVCRLHDNMDCEFSS